MIEKVIKEIENILLNSPKINEKKRSDLIVLIYKLKDDLEKVSEVDTKRALNLVQATKKSVDKAIAENNSSFEELIDLLDDFEVKHPSLTETLELLIASLTNLGI